jgi:hypothetical protein
MISIEIRGIEIMSAKSPNRTFIEEELVTLRGRLLEINSELVYAPDYFNGDNHDSAKLQLTTKPFPSLEPESPDYSAHALQAIFNISDLTARSLSFNGIIGLLTGNGKQLAHFFDYLDKTWVPHIIDETTHQAALALQQFLEKILSRRSDENEDDYLSRLFDFIPLFKGKVIDRVKKRDSLQKLRVMKAKLDQRIFFYKHIIKADAFSNYLANIKAMGIRLSILSDSVETPAREVGKVLIQIKKALDEITPDTPLFQSEKKLNDLSYQIEKLEQINNAWNKENVANNYPETLIFHQAFQFISNIISGRLSSDTLADTSTELESILNEDKFKKKLYFQEIGIGKVLSKKYDITNESLTALKIAVMNFHQQLNYAKAMNQLYREISNHLNYEANPYMVIHSNSPEKSLIQNAQQIEKLNKKLTELKLAQEEFNTALLHLHINNEVKDWFEAIKIKYHALFNTPTHQIEQSIKLAEQTIVNIQLEIDKASHQGRQNALRTLTHAVTAAFYEWQRTKYNFNKAQFKYNQLKQRIESTSASSIKKYQYQLEKTEQETVDENESIKNQQHCLTKIENSFSDRNKFLNTSLSALKKLQQQLDTATSLYDIVDKLSAEQLKQWFEINDDHGLLQDLTAYQQANARQGLNWTYLAQWLTSKINPYFADYQPDDLAWWKDEITARITAINAELAINNLDTKIDSNENYREQSNYALCQQYQEIKQKIALSSGRLQQLALNKSAIEQQQAQEQKLLANVLSQANLNKQQLAQQLTERQLQHKIAMLKLDLIQLEFQDLDYKATIDLIEHDISALLVGKIDKLPFEKQIAKLNKLENLIQPFIAIGNKTKEKLKSFDHAITALNQLSANQPMVQTAVTELNQKFQTLCNRYNSDYPNQVYLNHITLKRQEFITLQLQLLAQHYQTLYHQPVDTIKKELKQFTLKYQALANHAKAITNIDIQNYCKIIQSWQNKLDDKLQSHYQAKQQFLAFSTKLDKLYSNKEVRQKTLVNKVNHAKTMLDDYLQQRNQTYWLRDYFSNMAALTLGCFGYRSEFSQRNQYIDELKSNLDNYVKNKVSYEQVIKIINDGISKFKPRSAQSNHSLQYQLLSLKQQIKAKQRHKETPKHFVVS